MRRYSTVVAACAVLLLAAGAALADHHAVKITEKDGVGKYMTDAAGITLYVLKKDSPGKSTCEGPCLEHWPVYYREKVAAPAGIDPERFGTITRADGKLQTTYKGSPLYYFASDKAKGDTNGHGVRGVWSVAAP